MHVRQVQYYKWCLIFFEQCSYKNIIMHIAQYVKKYNVYFLVWLKMFYKNFTYDNSPIPFWLHLV